MIDVEARQALLLKIVDYSQRHRWDIHNLSRSQLTQIINEGNNRGEYQSQIAYRERKRKSE